MIASTVEALARQNPIGFARAFGVDLLLPFEETLAGKVLAQLDYVSRRESEQHGWGECLWTARDLAA